MPPSQDLAAAVDRYCLLRDLSEESEDQYRKIVQVFAHWSDGRPLTADTLSEFRRVKQRAGRSDCYVRSLRSHLLAVLRSIGDAGPVRPIRCGSLPVDTWGPDDVRRLVDGCDCLPEKRREYWRTLIQAAWWTGLSRVDLRLLTRSDVSEDGTIETARHKSGAPVLVWLPPAIVAHVATGQIWPRPWSEEWDRRVFARIVQHAGLRGTFKKLRRSSGVSVEAANPGHGHEHLGNSRPVFERHYQRQRQLRLFRPADLFGPQDLRAVE